MNRPLPIIAAFMITLAAPSAWAVPPPPDVPPPGFSGGWSGIYSPEVLTLFELAYKAERRGDERGALDLFEQAGGDARPRSHAASVTAPRAEERAGLWWEGEPRPRICAHRMAIVGTSCI